MGFCIINECKDMSLWDVLAWHRPQVTGVLLGSTLSIILFYCFMEYTMVTFLCRILQVTLLVGVLLGFTKRCSFTQDDIHGAVDRFVDCATPRAVAALQHAYQLATWHDYRASGQVLGLSIVAGFLGNMLSDGTLVVMVVVLAFSLPAVYEKKKDMIDAWVAEAEAFIEKYVGTIRTKVDEVVKKNE
ncbi:reticulon domain protein [Trypanosoma grayi]|uniref:reticulon domain protein n=1 Tax=Trypanosoma grayi TaxID=71804 RepID=UPI0004F42614|nr:reticulon domain protein [Trypanosoma grayi]KEG12877.1 reticulon domain protein [Trypanosoma grayi]